MAAQARSLELVLPISIERDAIPHWPPSRLLIIHRGHAASDMHTAAATSAFYLQNWLLQLAKYGRGSNCFFLKQDLKADLWDPGQSAGI